MKMKYILPVICGMAFFCACSKEVETVPEINVFQKEEYTIPISDALSSLEDFMIENGYEVTKGGLNDYIDNYFTVSEPGTKASDSQGDVLYAVNFKDDGGYAVLAADTRIGEDILAVTDQGSVTESDFDDPTFEKVPTENDDLSVSEYDAMVESGVLAALDKPINRQLYEYARNRVDDNDVVYRFGGTASGSGGSTDYGFTYKWITTREVPRMLNTAWTQSTNNNDIFNKYCPEVGLIWKTKAPAGCVCIALSQIIAYHEYPDTLICNDLQINYKEMKKVCPYEYRWYCGTDTGKEMVAKFCINVGSWCNTKYHSIFGYDLGLAWPSDAKSCLEGFGYKNVSLNWNYDESRVLESLDNGCPVFMSAVAGAIAGHAWVIDGYMKRDYFAFWGSQLYGTRPVKSQTLVHCNWGWWGSCNGYFTSGVFNTQEAENYDFTSGNSENHNYWYGFNTITYDNPQE